MQYFYNFYQCEIVIWVVDSMDTIKRDNIIAWHIFWNVVESPCF